jgi:hypothetical protein
MCAGGARFMLWPVGHSERGEYHIERDNTLTPRSFSILAGGNNSSNTSTAQRFATVFNADIQVGVSYWFTQNVNWESATASMRSLTCRIRTGAQ